MPVPGRNWRRGPARRTLEAVTNDARLQSDEGPIRQPWSASRWVRLTVLSAVTATVALVGGGASRLLRDDDGPQEKGVDHLTSIDTPAGPIQVELLRDGDVAAARARIDPASGIRLMSVRTLDGATGKPWANRDPGRTPRPLNELGSDALSLIVDVPDTGVRTSVDYTSCRPGRKGRFIVDFVTHDSGSDVETIDVTFGPQCRVTDMTLD